MAESAPTSEELSALSPSELQGYVEALRTAFEQRGLPWPVEAGGAAPAKVSSRRPLDDDGGDDEDEEGEEEDEEEGEDQDADALTSCLRTNEKVFFDFRLGELPVEHEGQPARLMRTPDSGEATVLSVPAGGYLKLPLNFPENHGATVTSYTLVVELRCSHPRPFSLFQATWPEVSASHATISECLVDQSRVVVGGAESEKSVRSLETARQQNRFVRLYFVCNAAESNIQVFSNGDLALAVGSLPAGGSTRWALDRKGMLLLASNSPSYMPGSIEIKRVELHRRLFSSLDIQAHVSQRWSFRGAALSAALRRFRGKLALAALDKKPQPLWCDLSFLAHFCDVFMDINNGKIYRSLQIILLGLEKLAAEKSSLLGPTEQEAVKKVTALFDSSLDLFRKYDRTRGEAATALRS